MQRSHYYVPALLTLALGASACEDSPTAPPAIASTAHSLSISAVPVSTTITLNVGTTSSWTATGGIEDAGSVFFDRFFVSAFTSVVNVAHVTTIQTSERGSFTMDFQRVTPGPIPWELNHGTGAYATLQGTGTCTRTVTPDGAIVTCTGDVHFF